MGGRHRQEVPDGRGGQPRMKLFRQFVRKVVGDPIVEGEPAFVDHHPDRQRDEAFADRIHPVLAVSRPGGPVSLSGNSVATYQQEPVHADSLGVDPLQKIQDRP